MNGNLTFFIKLNKRATLNWRFTILRRLSWVFFFLTLNSAYPNPCIPLAKWFVLQLQWFSCLSILWFIFINNIKKVTPYPPWLISHYLQEWLFKILFFCKLYTYTVDLEPMMSPSTHARRRGSSWARVHWNLLQECYDASVYEEGKILLTQKNFKPKI